MKALRVTAAAQNAVLVPKNFGSGAMRSAESGTLDIWFVNCLPWDAYVY